MCVQCVIGNPVSVPANFGAGAEAPENQSFRVFHGILLTFDERK